PRCPREGHARALSSQPILAAIPGIDHTLIRIYSEATKAHEYRRWTRLCRSTVTSVDNGAEQASQIGSAEHDPCHMTRKVGHNTKPNAAALQLIESPGDVFVKP